ncbi:MAG: response regulator, partial [Desulfobacterota bacterium]|nr:response regulator [Thermodesulfobacteriota bacterium]
EAFPIPYVSSTLAGCVENAKDATQGGAKYNFASIVGRGVGTTADSLAALKHLVYDTRAVGMDGLLAALDANFEGHDGLRMTLRTKAPKYGEDDDGADAIARDLVTFFCAEVARERSLRGGAFRPGFFSYGMHVIDGLFLGATPDGRRAGEPVSNSFSPSNGAERRGPTAALNSVAKMPATMISNGYALNMKLVRTLLQLLRIRVLEAGDAENGIQTALQELPELILMDIQLPGMDGLEATRIIKQNSALKHVPVVALTSYAMQGDEERALAAGCSGYITKPIDTKRFPEIIGAFLSKEK